MNRREADYRDYIGAATHALSDPGLLLCAHGLTGDPPNAMTIGWATFGVIWGLPICVVLVRPSRYTYGLIEASRDFTVNVPSHSLEEEVSFCGTTSGREHDKFAETGLTPLQSRVVRAPTVGECAVTFECKVVHWNDVVPANLADQVSTSSYPRGDFHRLYYGHILTTTIQPEAEGSASA
ncbi:MAG: flavin reductase family protein [Anaerolineae bacterium]